MGISEDLLARAAQMDDPERRARLEDLVTEYRDPDTEMPEDVLRQEADAV